MNPTNGVDNIINAFNGDTSGAVRINVGYNDTSTANYSIFGHYSSGSVSYAYIMKGDSGSNGAQINVHKNKIALLGLVENNNQINVNSSTSNAINVLSNQGYTRITVGRNYTNANKLYLAYACVLNDAGTAISTQYGYIKNSGGDATMYYYPDRITTSDCYMQIRPAIPNSGNDVPGLRILNASVPVNKDIQFQIGIGTGDNECAEMIYYHDGFGHGKLGLRNLTNSRVVFDRNGWQFSYKITVNGTAYPNSSRTITHLSPVLSDEDYENIEVGQPVFRSGNVYKIQTVEGTTDEFEFVDSSVNDMTDCVPGVKSSGTYKQFIGIVTAKHDKNVVFKIDDAVTYVEKFTQNTVEFATHGDFMFKIPSGHTSSEYSVGDEIMFDGSIVDDESPLTMKISRSLIGSVTKIFENEGFLAVFKD